MLFDKKAQFSFYQEIRDLGSTQGENTYDIFHGNSSLPSTPYNGRPLSDLGGGEPPTIVGQVVEEFDSAGAATLQMQIIQGDEVNSSTGEITTGLEVVAQSGAVPLESLVPGYQFRIALTHGITKRYFGVNWVVGTAAMTAGAVVAGITPNVQGNYPGR